METTRVINMGVTSPFVGIYPRALKTDEQKLAYLQELYGRREIPTNVYLDLGLFLDLPEEDVYKAVRLFEV